MLCRFNHIDQRTEKPQQSITYISPLFFCCHTNKAFARPQPEGTCNGDSNNHTTTTTTSSTTTVSITTITDKNHLFLTQAEPLAHASGKSDHVLDGSAHLHAHDILRGEAPERRRGQHLQPKRGEQPRTHSTAPKTTIKYVQRFATYTCESSPLRSLTSRQRCT